MTKYDLPGKPKETQFKQITLFGAAEKGMKRKTPDIEDSKDSLFETPEGQRAIKRFLLEFNQFLTARKLPQTVPPLRLRAPQAPPQAPPQARPFTLIKSLPEDAQFHLLKNLSLSDLVHLAQTSRGEQGLSMVQKLVPAIAESQYPKDKDAFCHFITDQGSLCLRSQMMDRKTLLHLPIGCQAYCRERGVVSQYVKWYHYLLDHSRGGGWMTINYQNKTRASNTDLQIQPGSVQLWMTFNNVTLSFNKLEDLAQLESVQGLPLEAATLTFLFKQPDILMWRDEMTMTIPSLPPLPWKFTLQNRGIQRATSYFS